MDIHSIDWESDPDQPASRYWVRRQFGCMFLYKAVNNEIAAKIGPYYAIIDKGLATEERISNLDVLMAQALIYAYGGERYYGK
jgi:hypothetical protein